MFYCVEVFVFLFVGVGASQFRANFFPRHPERGAGAADRDFLPAAQKDEFLDMSVYVVLGV